MKRFGPILCLCALLTPGLTLAADDGVSRGMKLCEQRRYDQAITLLRPLASGSGSNTSARLALGIAYLRNAELHARLQRMAVLVYPDYLQRLSKEKGEGSTFVNLYLGEYLLESGKAKEAAPYLERFIASNKVPASYTLQAQLDLGLCRKLAGDAAAAKALWQKGTASSDPEVLARLAAIYVLGKIEGEKPEELCRRAVESVGSKGKLSLRLVRNLLLVYGRTGDLDRGLALAESADLKAFSFEESLGKNKTLYFYEPLLLDDLARLYGEGSKAALTAAAGDPKLRAAANLYLAEAALRFGNRMQTLALAREGAPQLPPVHQKRLALLAAAAQQRQGDKEPMAALLQREGDDPELLAEALRLQLFLFLDATATSQQATVLLPRTPGKKGVALNGALGSYWLSKQLPGDALVFLEAARDKAHKNKIEANEPLLLVDLSEAYFRSKKFSEAQEIYFELAKEFPAVRLIQEGMQGIYSREQKSAGDVRIL
ncbi:MAG: hypothetical protein A2005_07100 [Desulfuromonadales bacterium GWC2_61_20]|nr:MAG: hypothetical protein A2005_07100 [Desulfuromonadales bacterium GWC2_61_20]